VVEASDEALLAAWAEGDAGSGEALFGRHFEAVYRFFRNKVDRDAQELTQRTFLRCVELQARFEHRSSFRTFLFGIARNVIREYLRERSKAQRIDFATTPAVDLGVSMGTRIAESQEQRLLLLALRSVPLDVQELVELYYWEGLSVAELARLLGVPGGTVKRRLWRARQRLADALGTMEMSDELRRSTLSTLESWAASVRPVDPASDDS
jgi:RNA polymerase sigma-70 factor (ECF subfamily)